MKPPRLLLRCPQVHPSTPQVGQLLRAQHNINRTLFITDQPSSKAKSRQLIQWQLLSANIQPVMFHWSETVGSGVEPQQSTVEAALEMFNKTGCDSVVGVGCDTSLNTAKAVAAVVAKKTPTPTASFVAEDYVGLLKNPTLPGSRSPPKLALFPLRASTAFGLDWKASFINWKQETRFWSWDVDVSGSAVVNNVDALTRDGPVTPQGGIVADAVTSLVRAYDVLLNRPLQGHDDDVDELLRAGIANAHNACEGLSPIVDRMIADRPDKLSNEEIGAVMLGNLHAGWGVSQCTLGKSQAVYGKDVRTTLLSTVVESLCSQYPLLHRDVTLAVYKPCLLKELEFLEHELVNSAIEAKRAYAETRLANVQSLGETLAVDFRNLEAWGTQVNEFLEVEPLDQLGVILEPEELEIVVDRILELGFFHNFPVSKELVVSIINSSCSKDVLVDA